MEHYFTRITLHAHPILMQRNLYLQKCTSISIIANAPSSKLIAQCTFNIASILGIQRPSSKRLQHFLMNWEVWFSPEHFFLSSKESISEAQWYVHFSQWEETKTNMNFKHGVGQSYRAKVIRNKWKILQPTELCLFVHLCIWQPLLSSAFGSLGSNPWPSCRYHNKLH